MFLIFFAAIILGSTYTGFWQPIHKDKILKKIKYKW